MDDVDAAENGSRPKRRGPTETRARPERAGVVGCYGRPRERAAAEESLDELAALAEAAGAQVVVRAMQERAHPDPALFVGRGKAEELRSRAEDEDLDLLVFDDELSPGQQRNLEKKVDRKILDRTQLILDIFARRARTREGKLQVELAQLNYLLPRLSGKGTMLSRLGAGIGTRGPGETKLEVDRRRIRNRIALLRREIEAVRRQRQLQRARRQGVPLPVVALVGYTNAGKSTLFNALTDAGTVESRQLFATLDPLLRRLKLPSGLEIVLSDTVGFVRKLSHQIVAAFRATLEEVEQATLVLHVIDVSSPTWREQAAAVETVLEELGVAATPRMEVYNKIDRLESPPRERSDDARHGAPVLVSATRKTGIGELLERMSAALGPFLVEAELLVPYAEPRLLARLHQDGRVRSERFEDDGVRVEVALPRQEAQGLRRYRIASRPPRKR